MTHRNMDDWITGNYGYDHPDNQVDPWDEMAERYRYEIAMINRIEKEIDAAISEGRPVTAYQASWRPNYRREEWA